MLLPFHIRSWAVSCLISLRRRSLPRTGWRTTKRRWHAAKPPAARSRLLQWRASRRGPSGACLLVGLWVDRPKVCTAHLRARLLHSKPAAPRPSGWHSAVAVQYTRACQMTYVLAPLAAEPLPKLLPLAAQPLPQGVARRAQHGAHNRRCRGRRGGDCGARGELAAFWRQQGCAGALTTVWGLRLVWRPLGRLRAKGLGGSCGAPIGLQSQQLNDTLLLCRTVCRCAKSRCLPPALGC